MNINKNNCANDDLSSGDDKILFSRIKKALLEEDVIAFEKKMKAPYQKKAVVYYLTRVAAVFIAALGLWFAINISHPSKHLFRQYYKPFPSQQVNEIFRSKNLDESNGASSYINGDYSNAILEFENRLQKSPNDYESRLLLAISYIESHQFENAAVQLHVLLNAPENYYSDDAKWYLSLVLVKLEQYKEARLILKQISSLSPYFAVSQKLIKKIPE